MKIKKIGHSSILIEEGGTSILIDPGIYSSGIESIRGINAICITHEHADHFDINILKKILAHNRQASVYSNSGVGETLKNSDINYQEVIDGDLFTINNLSVSVHGKNHALIDHDLPSIINTGFFINNTLYHPGDALSVPPVKIAVLALPIMAPWAKISEMLDYIREVKPIKLFPIHEELIKELGLYERQAMRVCKLIGTEYLSLNKGEEIIV